MCAASSASPILARRPIVLVNADALTILADSPVLTGMHALVCESADNLHIRADGKPSSLCRIVGELQHAPTAFQVSRHPDFAAFERCGVAATWELSIFCYVSIPDWL